MRAVALGLLLLLGGCASLPSRACPGGSQPATEARLYLGRNIAGQPGVSEAEFRAFLDAEVTPRFPDGLTVLDAEGRWRGADGKVEAEASKVLVLILPQGGASAEARLSEVRAAYQRAFRQESVLMTTQTICASF